MLYSPQHKHPDSGFPLPVLSFSVPFSQSGRAPRFGGANQLPDMRSGRFSVRETRSRDGMFQNGVLLSRLTQMTTAKLLLISIMSVFRSVHQPAIELRQLFHQPVSPDHHPTARAQPSELSFERQVMELYARFGGVG